MSTENQAIQYIEEQLWEELTIREVAQQAALFPPFYFQKGFARFHAQVPPVLSGAFRHRRRQV